MSQSDDEEEEVEPTVIGVQHDITFEEPEPLNFSFLLASERELSDGDFQILPVSEYPDGFEFVVHFTDTKDQVPCYIIDSGNKSYGWCRCEAFGNKGICRHLFAAYKWQQGVVEAANEEVARAGLKKVKGGEVDDKFYSDEYIAERDS